MLSWSGAACLVVIMFALRSESLCQHECRESIDLPLLGSFWSTRLAVLNTSQFALICDAASVTFGGASYESLAFLFSSQWETAIKFPLGYTGFLMENASLTTITTIQFNPCGSVDATANYSACSGSICVGSDSYGDLASLQISPYTAHASTPWFGLTFKMTTSTPCTSSPGKFLSSVIHVLPDVSQQPFDSWNSESAVYVESSSLTNCTLDLTLHSYYLIPNMFCIHRGCARRRPYPPACATTTGNSVYLGCTGWERTHVPILVVAYSITLALFARECFLLIRMRHRLRKYHGLIFSQGMVFGVATLAVATFLIYLILVAAESAFSGPLPVSHVWAEFFAQWIGTGLMMSTFVSLPLVWLRVHVENKDGIFETKSRRGYSLAVIIGCTIIVVLFLLYPTLEYHLEDYPLEVKFPKDVPDLLRAKWRGLSVFTGALSWSLMSSKRSDVFAFAAIDGFKFFRLLAVLFGFLLSATVNTLGTCYGTRLKRLDAELPKVDAPVEGLGGGSDSMPDVGITLGEPDSEMNHKRILAKHSAFIIAFSIVGLFSVITGLVTGGLVVGIIDTFRPNIMAIVWFFFYMLVDILFLITYWYLHQRNRHINWTNMENLTRMAVISVKVKGQQAGQSIKTGAEKAGQSIKSGAEKAGQSIKTGAEKAGQSIKSGAEKALNVLRHGSNPEMPIELEKERNADDQEEDEDEDEEEEEEEDNDDDDEEDNATPIILV